jgi:hypothetical protein
VVTQPIHVDIGAHRVTVNGGVVVAGGQPVNVLANPSAWGWPDHTNTGVPDGVQLSPSGSLTVSTAGTVLQDLDIAGGVTVRANDVVIRRCRIHRTPSPGFGAIRMQNDPRGLLVEDCEMFYEGFADASSVIGGGGYYTLNRCHIHDITEGPRLASGCTVQDSHLHHLRRLTGGGGHHDLLQATVGDGISIVRNTLLAYNPELDDPFNAAIILKSDSGPVTNVLVEGNLMNGGNNTLYLTRAHHPVGPATVRDNRFGRDFRFGTISTSNVDGLVMAGNVWDDSNAPVS